MSRADLDAQRALFEVHASGKGLDLERDVVLETEYYFADTQAAWEAWQAALAAQTPVPAPIEGQSDLSKAVLTVIYRCCQAGTSPERLHAAVMALFDAAQALVHDDHQAFIDTLEGEEKMFEQIDCWARESYRRHKYSARGQQISRADGMGAHVIWATLRWEKEQAARAPAQGEPVASDAEDAARLDWLGVMGNEPEGILLHDGGDFTGRRGLGLRRIGRTLRVAIDAARKAGT